MAGLSVLLWNGGYGLCFSVPISCLKADWLPFYSHVSIDLSAIIDPISVMMIVVVTVHVVDGAYF